MGGKISTYAQAGVDIEEADRAVEKFSAHIKKTDRPGVMGGFGGFGGLFDLKATGYHDPVLVSGTDGVGTKLRIALDCEDFSTIGQDLVAMVVNDLLVQAAEPAFFLDYLAVGKLEAEIAEQIVASIARGCQLAGCALIGGETAEMPGFYAPGDLDMAGFGVGLVEREHLLPKMDGMRKGDLLLGIASSGLHSNGYSLARSIVKQADLAWTDPLPFDQEKTIGRALLEPTQLYVRPLLEPLRSEKIKGAAHITGGGLENNVARILPEGLKAKIDWQSWERPALFSWLQQAGDCPEADFRLSFNCGIGFALIVSANEAVALLERLLTAGEQAFIIGELESA